MESQIILQRRNVSFIEIKLILDSSKHIEVKMEDFGRKIKISNFILWFLSLLMRHFKEFSNVCIHRILGSDVRLIAVKHLTAHFFISQLLLTIKDFHRLEILIFEILVLFIRGNCEWYHVVHQPYQAL